MSNDNWSNPIESLSANTFTQPGTSGFGAYNWGSTVDWERTQGSHATVFIVTNANSVSCNIIVQASLDGSNWFTTSTGTANGTGVTYLGPAGSPVTARYVRAGISLDGPGSDTVTVTTQHVAQE